jgi:SrtB family sortase
MSGVTGKMSNRVCRMKKRRKSNNNLLYTAADAVLHRALCSQCIFSSSSVSIRDSRSEADIKALESKITETIPEEKIPDVQTSGQATGEVAGQATGKIVGQTVTDYRSRYQALLEENPDFIGWIRIPDTKVDLPVVWRKGDNAFYLKHGFDGQKSEYGVPFLDEKCDPDPKSLCNNYVIYGHHMKTGTVFAGLLKYEDPELPDNSIRRSPSIRSTRDGTYEIFGAFACGRLERTRHSEYYEDTAME